MRCQEGISKVRGTRFLAQFLMDLGSTFYSFSSSCSSFIVISIIIQVNIKLAYFITCYMTKTWKEKIQAWLQPGKNQTLGMVLIIIGKSLFLSGFIYANQNNFSPFLTLMVRGFVSFLMCYFVGRAFGMDFDFKSSQNMKWLIFRSFIMSLQSVSYAAVQFFIPLPIAATLNACNPISVFMIDYYMFNVRVNRIQVIAIIGSFFGMIMITNGPYFMHLISEDYKMETDFQNYVSDDPIVKGFAGLVHFIVMMIHGFGVVITKKLVNANAFHVTVHQAIFMILLGAFFGPCQWNRSGNFPSQETYWWSFLYVGVVVTVGQMCYVTALIINKNHGLTVSLSLLSIAYGYLLSIFRYGQTVNLVCLVGVVLIVIGIVIAVMWKDKHLPVQVMDSDEKYSK